jgi:glycosyltransferase involved in cell wall biosynthesis
MLRKYKIVIYLSSIPVDGGKFQYSLLLASACQKLEEKGFYFTYVYRDLIWKKYLPINSVKIRENNYFIKVLKLLFFKFFPTAGRDFWRKIGKYIDMNHQTFFSLKPDLIIYAAKDPFIHEVNLPGLIPVFDLMHKYEKFPELNEIKIYIDREIYYSRLCKYAKGILVDSEIGKRHLLDNYEFKEKHIHVLPYIAPFYVYEKYNFENISQKFSLPDEFIFYPAQFWEHKNHIAIIKSLKILKDKGLLIHCVFVGSKKNAYEFVYSKIDEYELNPQFIFLDYVSNEELVFLYKKAKALVMPTFLGPTNIPQLEAFALGCPVITSNIYGIPEQVGNAALLINPNDEISLSNAIFSIYSNNELRLNLIEEGYLKDKNNNLSMFSNNLSNAILESLKN